MSSAPLRFWFDFISPFGYLASLRIDAIAARHDRRVDWHPLLLGVTVLKVMGLPPVLGTPLKGEYALRQLARYRRRHGIAMARDPAAAPMNPLPAGRLFAWLRVHAPENARPFAQAALHAYWCDCKPLDVDLELRAAAARAAVPASTVEAGLADPDAARLLRVEVDGAVAAGAFGSPFVIADDEPFFGVDSLELLDEWLARAGW